MPAFPTSVFGHCCFGASDLAVVAGSSSRRAFAADTAAIAAQKVERSGSQRAATAVAIAAVPGR